MLIASKYPGKCSACGTPISVGDLISWRRGERSVFHAGCSAEGKAMTASEVQSRATDSDLEIPAPDGLDYLPYQRAGVEFALERRGTIIGDEMGLGKTIQAIGVINAVPDIRRVIIVCPASLKLNWLCELRRWLVRPMRCGLSGASDVQVVSFDGAKKIADSRADLLIVDEGQFCKNPRTQRTKACLQLAKSADRVIVLTGTPIPNRIIELFPLLKMADPETWDPSGKGWFRFATRYANAMQGRFGLDVSGSSNLDELQLRLRGSCLLRRLKSEVLKDLPSKRRQVVLVGKATGKASLELEALGIPEEDFSALEDSFSSLSGILTTFDRMAEWRAKTGNAKAPAAIEHITNCLESTDGKVVVFAHHHAVIDSLVEGLKSFGVVKLDGRDNGYARNKAVCEFQENPAIRVFVGGLQAAGTGLTLTAASTCVMVELGWTPSEMLQAEDRLHRIGQMSSVNVHYLVLDGSLDARITELLVRKLNVAEKALDTGCQKLQPVEAKQEKQNSKRSATEGAKRNVVDSERVAIALTGLRTIAGNCDGARELDGCGFNKFDAGIGKSLAVQSTLTESQLEIAERLCRKYKRQLAG